VAAAQLKIKKMAGTKRIRVGVVGCGAIGSEICKAIDGSKLESELELRFLVDNHPERIERLCESLKRKPEIIKYDSTGLEEILEAVDLVVECASQAAVREFVVPALRQGKDAMILSVGALLCEPGLFEEVERLSGTKGCKVYIPSGAVAGVDGLKSAAGLGGTGGGGGDGGSGVRSVELTTRKPPRGFEGNKYVKQQGINLASIKQGKRAETLFEGSAREAVRHFPENVNVAASLSLAGLGPEATRVRIVADPSAVRNVHEVEVLGEFGRLFVRVENVPSRANPKTSFLAALSAIATLRGILSPLRVGT